MEYTEYRDFTMHDVRKEEYGWESTVRLMVGREDELGMYLEESREGRKRKWQPEKMRRDGSEDKDQKKVPPKKIMAALSEIGGSGTSSSSSHLSPAWQVNELDLDLPVELSMNEALLSLPSLAVFKQEAPSPTGAVLSPPRRHWPVPRRNDDRQMTSMVVDGARDGMDECQQSPSHNGNAMQHGSPDALQCQQQMPPSAVMPMNGYHSPNEHENKNAGLLICSPVGSLEGYLHSPPHLQQRSDSSFKDDTRFQYVLAAATSIATKQNEETLTYLNQGQSYEIKLKKLGDLSHYKGKLLKSVIKICFHERRLQYMEREQIAQWHAERPGERIVEVDVPLSYGIIKVEQSTALNALHVYWDATKDVGVYIKVNCISTEFTAKKHGGEKGVPFRIQVETYLASDENNRLNAAACQIKVFKLKGADRKHKQDREKVLRRPRADLDKYQPACEATVLTTLSHDALMPPPSLVTTSPSYSPELCVTPKSASSPIATKPISQPAIVGTTNQMKPLYCQDAGEMKVSSPTCHSPGAILPDLPQPAEEPDKNFGLSKDATSAETQVWLSRQRFMQHAATFANFSGADLLRLSRDDIIQIVGLADGIRLFNALHAKRISPRLTLYVCPPSSDVHCALYLHACRAHELLHKLNALQGAGSKDCETVLVSGPNGARVRLTDELVRHLPDNSTYRLKRLEDCNALLLSATTGN
ncbi:transcription factor CP2-like protein 1 [Bombyx mandarina]|uniref:Grh/CP2 DB domain-containing protein n=2 Tax=Bombyx TaxID=7090 RepID=A0A8R2RB23_BOMMO|nr:transcription factor CP2-like protein 1 [Bombyx mandarina]XP_037877247.1 transcription factor CP2-like protein 1 isoform X3 [Bombyx mori]